MTKLLLLPNVHLLLAHLSAALLFAGTVFLVAGRLLAARSAGDSLLHAGRWNVFGGALVGIIAVATGALVVSQARLSPAAAVTAALHLRTAVVATVLALGAAFAIRQAPRAPGWIALAILAVSCGAGGVSAVAGAQLIHRHGVGIEKPREEPRMPVAMVVHGAEAAGAVSRESSPACSAHGGCERRAPAPSAFHHHRDRHA